MGDIVEVLMQQQAKDAPVELYPAWIAYLAQRRRSAESATVEDAVEFAREQGGNILDVLANLEAIAYTRKDRVQCFRDAAEAPELEAERQALEKETLQRFRDARDAIVTPNVGDLVDRFGVAATGATVGGAIGSRFGNAVGGSEGEHAPALALSNSLSEIDPEDTYMAQILAELKAAEGSRDADRRIEERRHRQLLFVGVATLVLAALPTLLGAMPSLVAWVRDDVPVHVCQWLGEAVPGWCARSAE